MNQHLSAARLFYSNVGKLQLKQMDSPPLPQHLGQEQGHARLSLHPGLG